MKRDNSYLIGNQFAKGSKPNKTAFKKGQHASPKTEFKKGCKINLGKKYPNKKSPPSFSKTHRQKIGKANERRIISLKTRKKLSKANTKENNPNWKGGISNNPYPKKFNAKLKLEIRQRDNFTCCLCGRTEREELEELNQALCVNHIDFDKNNCKEENLNTLCLKCNTKINREREYWTNHFNKL